MTTSTATVAAPRRRRLQLSTQILIGIGAGVAIGLFVGERAARLQVLADAYIRLLQMTVLPYVTMSLVGGLGALNRQEAARLGSRVGSVLLMLWGIALVGVFSLPTMFPRGEAATFFSTTLLDDGAPFDLLGLYIPANPFNALANNIVPAVVLFSSLLGIALIGVPGKATALKGIEIVRDAVERLARSIVALTPFGIFAIAAVTAGTLDLDQAAQLQVYLASYLAVSLLLSLWVLPGLVAAVTPVPHRALIVGCHHALLLAFATGSLLVVLPLLVEQTRRLLREHADLSPQDGRLPDVIVPAAFNFPHTGKLLSLGFILFAAWFTGGSIAPSRYPMLGATGVLALFGSSNVAVPFLLDMFRIPADTFQLFLATGVVTARFGTLLAAVHTLTIALVGTCAVAGTLRIDARKLLRFAVVTLILGAAVLGGTRVLIASLLSRPYEKDKVLASMQAVRDRGQAEVHRTAVAPLPPPDGSVLDRLYQRKTLRVGYFADSLPYSFANASGDIVGFDIEMALQLSRDLRVALELVPADRQLFETGLDPRSCDLVMSGTAVTADRAVHVLFSTPYLDETLALIVPDHRRAEFSSWDDLQLVRPLRLGVLRVPYYLNKIRAELPGAEVVEFDDAERMFQPLEPPLDALVLTAERGSAYTLRHPAYSVVVPKPRPVKVPLAYVIAGKDQTLAAVVNTWIDLKRKDGTIDELFSHWILGRDAVPHKRRWSLLDDVLRWKK